MPISLILGGVRSGKSRLAEQLAHQTQQPVTYIATAQAHDQEMHERIQDHQKRRPPHWKLIEEPFSLGTQITNQQSQNGCLIIDCLTLWITNLLLNPDPLAWNQERASFLTALRHNQCTLIIVSNETGLGIIPLGELSRRFVDAAGAIHQELAMQADTVIFMVAGLPQILKSPSQTKNKD